MKHIILSLNIAKGTTDPGVKTALTSNFGLVGLVQYAW